MLSSDKTYLLALTACAAVGLCFAAAPAEAAPFLFCSDGPGIDLVNQGCISGNAPGYPGGGDGVFSNAGGGDPLSAVEAAILGATGVSVNLTLLGKSDEGAPFTYIPNSGINLESSFSGLWNQTSGAGAVRYVTIVAATSFALYEYSPGASSGIYTTAGILNPGGQQPTVSHISFWTTPGLPPLDPNPVPEPSAFLLLGSGAVGLLWLRRRKAPEAGGNNIQKPGPPCEHSS